MPIPRSLSYLRTALFVLVFVGVLSVAGWIIYLAACASWPIAYAVPHFALKAALIGLTLATIAVVAASSRYNNSLTRPLYVVASLWMGLFVYLFLGAALYGIVVESAEMVGIVGPLAWLGQAIGIAAGAALDYGLINAWPIRRSRFTVSLPGTPPQWKGRRAVFLSDIHLGQIHTARFARRVATAVNEERPDIVFIGGDLFDGVKVDEHAVIAPFAAVQPLHGVHFITGNHEEFEDSAHFLNAIRSLGIRVLTNELADVDGLQVIGVTDHDSVHKDKLAAILAGLPIDRSRAAILLKHQPSHVAVAEAAGVSLMLSGHTHRAQLFPLNVVPYWIYKGFSYGQKKFKDMHVYTSSGVGSWGPPMRIGSDSEIVVIEFV